MVLESMLNFCARIALAAALTTACARSAPAQSVIAPQTMKVLGEVDPRYVSYNVEAVEVTGGRFWAPYKSFKEERPPAPNGNQPINFDSNRFQYRPPIDLSNTKLRHLAAALGPAYVRVSGTWRNATYFQDIRLPTKVVSAVVGSSSELPDRTSTRAVGP
jgi:hypothetical protein